MPAALVAVCFCSFFGRPCAAPPARQPGHPIPPPCPTPLATSLLAPPPQHSFLLHFGFSGLFAAESLRLCFEKEEEAREWHTQLAAAIHRLERLGSGGACRCPCPHAPPGALGPCPAVAARAAMPLINPPPASVLTCCPAAHPSASFCSASFCSCRFQLIPAGLRRRGRRSSSRASGRSGGRGACRRRRRGTRRGGCEGARGRGERAGGAGLAVCAACQRRGRLCRRGRAGRRGWRAHGVCGRALLSPRVLPGPARWYCCGRACLTHLWPAESGSRSAARAPSTTPHLDARSPRRSSACLPPACAGADVGAGGHASVRGPGAGGGGPAHAGEGVFVCGVLVELCGCCAVRLCGVIV